MPISVRRKVCEYSANCGRIRRLLSLQRGACVKAREGKMRTGTNLLSSPRERPKKENMNNKARTEVTQKREKAEKTNAKWGGREMARGSTLSSLKNIYTQQERKKKTYQKP